VLVTHRALELVEELLRSPDQLLERCRSGRDEQALFLCSLASIVLGSGAFGAVLATSRGGLQLLYSGAKLPLVLLATLALVAPALHALSRSFGRALPLRDGIALLMAAAARASLVLLALSPAVWLCFDRGLGYHDGVVLAAACYGFAGLFALSLVRRALGRGLRGALLVGSFGLVLLPTAGQTAWMCRPFLGRPAQAHVPFFRARESSFADAVFRSLHSSFGDYDYDHPGPEADGPRREAGACE
jgi:hypothetical protein